MITGEQRLRNIKTKARIVGRRMFAEFMTGERDVLECLADIQDEMIAREFDRLYATIKAWEDAASLGSARLQGRKGG